MTDKEININKYFVELTDIGGGTIGYTVPFPEELLRKIIKQNKQLKCKEQECEELKEENQQLRMHFCNDCGEKDDYNIPCKLIRDLDYELQKEIEENDHYREALKEIERICLEDTYTFADGTRVRYDTLDDILSIINKLIGD